MDPSANGLLAALNCPSKICEHDFCASVFHYHLTKCWPSPVNTTTNGVPDPAPSKTKVLLVDDSEDVLVVIQLSLEMLGYDVVACTDGAQAIKQFRATNPSIAIIDLGLPDMSGIEVGRQIRTIQNGINCPLILLTGNDGSKIRDEAQKAGFSDFLVKPVRIGSLSQCIAKRMLK